MEEFNFFVRQIKSSDENGLLQLRNNPEIYKWFLSKLPVEAMNHKNWMRARLKSFKEITLVAESSDSVIGTAYLSGLVNGKAEVSIRVEKASSGHGVGQLLLQKLIEQAKDMEFSTLYARVHKNNFDSIRFFENADFNMISVTVNSTEDIYNLEFFTYTLELDSR